MRDLRITGITISVGRSIFKTGIVRQVSSADKRFAYQQVEVVVQGGKRVGRREERMLVRRRTITNRTLAGMLAVCASVNDMITS